MAIDYQGLVTRGLAEQISDKIRDAILEGRLRASERLPTEEQLATRFNVSRPTIREALKGLASQHLIRTRRGPTGGTFVNTPTRDEVRHTVATATFLLVSAGDFTPDQIAEARRELELMCCRLAARRRTAAQLQALAVQIDRQRRAANDEEFCAAEVGFHRLLVEAAGNPALDLIAAGVIGSLPPAANRAICTRQHERMYQGLVARDADAACAALADYMASGRLRTATLPGAPRDAPEA